MYLSQDEVQRWLITYRIEPDQVIDLDSVVVYRDSTVAKITTTVYCWNLNRVAPKAFQVVISEMLPLKGDIPADSKMLTCTQAHPAPLEWRNTFSHPDDAPYRDRVRPNRAIHSAGKTLMRCPHCHRTEWVRQEVAES